MSALFSIKDKIILISGATGVLGSKITQHLATEGAQVIILGRNPNKVKDLVTSITNKGGKASALIADVTNKEALESAAQQVEKEFGGIDVLINAAGGNMPGAIVTPDQKITDLDIEEVKKVMELNYLGTLLPIQVFTPLLLHNPAVSIINISSMAASRPLTRVMGYASAKAAIDNLTKWLSVEFCQKYGKQYRVNAIAPGFFLTEQNRALLTEDDGSLTARGNQIISHTPMDRFGDPEDLFGAVSFLCSNASKFVTGTIIPVDGGFSAFGGV
ncbi:SDR family oxidoreductase [Echinicola rosea]|uniref:Dioxygenase n=1 Tax=Echinicola rosea TaxID=1807691 RepID=A0ABQ1V075_9BACT|nr:SDR family oxidoreductase [Echinicola rosea]GGF31172.1 dioxygenase [Echinicola rosea]